MAPRRAAVAVVALDLALEVQLLVLADRLVAAVRPVPLLQEPEVPALASLLVQGLVASEARLRSRQPCSAATARISPSPVQPTYERAPSTR